MSATKEQIIEILALESEEQEEPNTKPINKKWHDAVVELADALRAENIELKKTLKQLQDVSSSEPVESEATKLSAEERLSVIIPNDDYWKDIFPKIIKIMQEYAIEYHNQFAPVVDLRSELINFARQFYSDEETCIHNVNKYLASTQGKKVK